MSSLNPDSNSSMQETWNFKDLITEGHSTVFIGVMFEYNCAIICNYTCG